MLALTKFKLCIAKVTATATATAITTYSPFGRFWSTTKNESKIPNPKAKEIGIGSGVVWGCVSGRSVTPDDRSDGRALLVPQLGLLKIERARSIFGTGKKCDDSPTCGHLKKPWMQSTAHWVAPSSEKEGLNFRSF